MYSLYSSDRTLVKEGTQQECLDDAIARGWIDPTWDTRPENWYFTDSFVNALCSIRPADKA
jgi:hypothetical protein